MSLEGKNRKIFSYNNVDRCNCNFMYKDFEKTNSYHSSFRQANFNFSSLRGAKMKFCDFSGASFIGTEFVGTNLRGSNFSNACFKDAIFHSTVLDKAIFDNASFENCYFVCTGISTTKKFPQDCTGITFLASLPSADGFSNELLQVVEELRANDLICRSHTLHLKKGKVNTLSLQILLESFSPDDLICLLPKVPQQLTSQFYTLSYLRKLLKKMK